MKLIAVTVGAIWLFSPWFLFIFASLYEYAHSNKIITANQKSRVHSLLMILSDIVQNYANLLFPKIRDVLNFRTITNQWGTALASHALNRIKRGKEFLNEITRSKSRYYVSVTWLSILSRGWFKATDLTRKFYGFMFFLLLFLFIYRKPDPTNLLVIVLKWSWKIRLVLREKRTK